MQETLKHICSVTDICGDCPFLKSTVDSVGLNLRKHHLIEMQSDVVYRPNCKAQASEHEQGNHPICRGAAIYMVKKGRLNAALKLALDEGVVTSANLLQEADRVID